MLLSLFSFGHLLLDMGPTSKSGLLFLSELFLNKKIFADGSMESIFWVRMGPAFHFCSHHQFLNLA